MTDTPGGPPPLPDWSYTSGAEEAPKRRRRGWGWLIAVLIVAGLVVAAWFLGEWIARDLVTKAVREQVVTRLALPADQEVDVQIEGAMIPQLIGGTFDDITVSSDDVPLADALTGDITVHATGVQYRDAAARSATAEVSLDEAQVRALLATVEGFPADTVGIAQPNLTMSTAISLFGTSIPIGVALTPGAADGQLVLSPASLQLGGAEVTADALRSQFGGLADAVLRDWDVCIAQYVPAGLTLTQVEVDGAQVVADLTIDPAILTDAALRATGTCA